MQLLLHISIGASISHQDIRHVGDVKEALLPGRKEDPTVGKDIFMFGEES